MPPLSVRCPDSLGGSSEFLVVPAKEPDEDPGPRCVAFPNHRGEQVEAFLDDAGRWDCPKLPVLNRVLNALYPPKAGSEGRQAALRAVAAWLKGNVGRSKSAP